MSQFANNEQGLARLEQDRLGDRHAGQVGADRLWHFVPGVRAVVHTDGQNPSEAYRRKLGAREGHPVGRDDDHQHRSFGGDEPIGDPIRIGERAQARRCRGNLARGNSGRGSRLFSAAPAPQGSDTSLARDPHVFSAARSDAGRNGAVHAVFVESFRMVGMPARRGAVA